MDVTRQPALSNCVAQVWRRRCRSPCQPHRRAEGIVGAQHLLRLEVAPRPLAAQARHQRGVVGLARFGKLDPRDV